MKIKLTNFRCYKEAEFDLPDSGLVLLSGVSGSGKSTLLKAILYALYGTKAVKKPYSFGTNTASVYLEYNGMKIQRTSRPNRLVLNGEWEDEVAQKMIEERMFNLGYDEFTISSYISQKNNTSILSLTPMEQVKLLKVLSINGDKGEIYKEKIKQMLKSTNDLLNVKNGEYKLILTEIQSLKESVNGEYKFPVNCENIELWLTDYNKRLDITSNEINALLKIKESLLKINDLKMKQNILTEQLQEIPDLENLEDIKLSIQSLENELKFINLSIEIKQLEQEYKQQEDLEQNEKNIKIKELTSKLWLETSKNETKQRLELMKKSYDNYKIYESSYKKVNEISEELEIHCNGNLYDISSQLKNFINNKIEELQSKKYYTKTYKCPKCNTFLCIGDDKLEISALGSGSGSGSEKDLKQIKSELDYYTKLRLEIDKIKIVDECDKISLDDIKKLEKYYEDNCEREMYLNTLQNEESKVLKMFKTKINNKQNELNKYFKGLNEINAEPKVLEQQSLKVLEHKLKNEREKLVTLEIHWKRKEKLLCDINNIDKQLAGLSIDSNIDINTLNSKLNHLKNILDEDLKLKPKIDEYLKWKKLKDELDKWEERGNVLKDCIKDLENKHTAILILKEKWAQAEIIALETTLQNINEHTRYYLDTFFTEHFIRAELAADFSQTKVQTQTTIEYKGNEYENIGQLSGGEFDRCTLASVCGINTMLKSPILILDESMSSLDSDNNTEILRFLGEFAQDKLIIVASHEAVIGIFDTVITF